MKNLINLIIVLSLSAQACNAQKKMKTMEEYKVLHDSITSLVKLAGEDSSSYIGKSFSKFVKLLDKRGLKIKQTLWAIIATFIVGTIFVVGTFRSNAQTAIVAEKKIGNTVYKLNMSDNIYSLTNKANKIKNVIGGGGIVVIDNPGLAYKAFLEHFKPVFSKERAKELNFRIHLYCICDSTGQIIEVSISTYKQNYEKLTLSEIQAIEDAAKKYRIPFTEWHGGKEDKYVSYNYYLNPYLIYFEKQK